LTPSLPSASRAQNLLGKRREQTFVEVQATLDPRRHQQQPPRRGASRDDHLDPNAQAR
jgi:hypothetical protein